MKLGTPVASSQYSTSARIAILGSTTMYFRFGSNFLPIARCMQIPCFVRIWKLARRARGLLKPHTGGRWEMGTVPDQRQSPPVIGPELGRDPTLINFAV